MQTILLEDPLISRAALFSARRFAFAGLFSPYSGQAFINHPKAVAHKLTQISHSKTLLACAWLHSQLSLNFTDALEIEEQFGRDIAELIIQVAALNIPLTADLDALSRFDITGVEKASGELQTLILAELVTLAETVVVYQPSRFNDYLYWLNLALDALHHANPVLLTEARKLVENSCENNCSAH
ncbi:hypothetical protein [Alteromonas ponticola]|uniref:Uncharacterized protein n=1 Tax=Alteromonas ponticola TaxID=2720613 RepID=A0ABX1R1E5_9ALTE|nr:hypothetical protein [Alteromonas ponticola]NMH59292.1 hypothetical protein [Alteromonas ponticola]